jgi:hypothetical protein
MCGIFTVMDKKEIVDYLAKKVFDKELIGDKQYIMLKNKQIYTNGKYGKLVKSNKISPEDAFVYIDFIDYEDESYNDPFLYLFPLIDSDSINGIMDSYLDKLGFYNPNYSIYPATGLKYYAVVVLFSDRLVIELTDIGTMATNTGLRKIVIKVLGKNILTQNKISSYQLIRIDRELREQILFAGHNLGGVYRIIVNYYEEHDTSLAKEVLAVANAYNRVFEPYRVVYDTKTRQQVLI